METTRHPADPEPAEPSSPSTPAESSSPADSPKQYQPQGLEERWYRVWLEQKCFASQPDRREPYTVVIPPPNVTGVLHLGHMLNNTIQDMLVRKARMQGLNACWVPGTDHASIATEAKVVQWLKDQGIDKSEIGREAFLEYAWQWKEKYGGIILQQLRKLGASLDWDREAFTMDPNLSRAVVDAFVQLYREGLIYRGVRMVNWDPAGQTALADDEVQFKEVASQMVYLRYYFENSDQYLVVATVRPETIMADAAVCVHPEDERYAHLVGQKVMIPLLNKAIPLIADPYVDPGFGTGCLKVTPAHDPNDYELGLRHRLEVVDLLDQKGCLNENAVILVGKDRFTARTEIIPLLKEAGCLERIEPYTSSVGHSERTNAVVEPRLSLQWFVRMKDLAEPALQAVVQGEVRLFPDKFMGTYRHWMENCRDWCISRQLWWGHRIPAWYSPDGQIWVAPTLEEAVAQTQNKWTATDLQQDEDVLDTWFSSWLWPLSVFDPDFISRRSQGQNTHPALAYYYPTSVLVTGPDILFFWVARMIMAGQHFHGQNPFRDVYLTGIVRDKQGRKMSKSLGNSPDPLALIEQFGADSLRMSLLFASPAGNDLLFDESQLEQGRHFANKLWNAYRLLQTWQDLGPEKADDFGPQSQAVFWFSQRLAQACTEVEQAYQNYRLSEVIRLIYQLIWDDFCSWYLEMVKPQPGQKMRHSVLEQSAEFMRDLLALLHPVMPFVTEDLFHKIKNLRAADKVQADNSLLCLAAYPMPETFDASYLNQAGQALNLVASLRHFKSQHRMSPRQHLVLYLPSGLHFMKPFEAMIQRLAFAALVFEEPSADTAANWPTLMCGTHKVLVDPGQELDTAQNLEQLQKDLLYQQQFLKSVQAKLLNPSFAGKAPAQVLALEQKKEEDALHKIRNLEEEILRQSRRNPLNG